MRFRPLPSLLLSSLLLAAFPALASAAVQTPRIISGTAAADGTWPWTVSIEEAGYASQDGHFCGGTVIAPRVVLTAAHCVSDEKTNAVTAASDMQVTAGRTTLSDTSKGKTIPVVRVVRHPKYDPEATTNDLALLFLGQDAGAPALKFVTAAQGDIWSGQTGWVAGWGATTDGGQDTPDTLRQVDAPILTDSGCASREQGFDAAYNICQLVTAEGHDSCQGDSGGPLMVADGAGGYTLVGIVSWGAQGCGHPGAVGIYTRVAKYSAWISQQLSGGGGGGGKDTVKPRVKAYSVSAWAGETAHFVYKVAEASHVTRETLYVLNRAGTRTIRTIRSAYGQSLPGTRYQLSWRIPYKYEGQRLPYCIVSEDKAHNKSAASCAYVRVK